MSSSWGMMKVVFLTFLARILSFCCIKVNPPGVPIQWFPDDQFEFRGRIEVNLLNISAYFCARCKNSKKWQRLHSCSFNDSNLQLIGSTGGSGTARMSFDGDKVDVHLCAFKSGGKVSDTTTYDRFSVKTGRYLRRVAGGHAKSDITGFVDDPKTGKAQFLYYEEDKVSVQTIPGVDDFDKLEEDLRVIKRYLHLTMQFHIVSRGNDDDVWVIYAENDVGHSMFKGSTGAYFLYTRAAQAVQESHSSYSEVSRNIEFLFASRPEMKKYKLSRMDGVYIKARDGEDILCYLSRTQARPTIKGRQIEPDGPPPPLVMLIHGGPQARDSWGYNPMCQFLCSRGFRVLQVNYRGSTGFGARFLQKGMDGEFYKSLQNDIVDAVNCATSQSDTLQAIKCDTTTSSTTDVLKAVGAIPPRPWGDPNQLAIVGGSFGGYSALWQMTANPGLFRCAVAMCPLSAVGAADDLSKKSFYGSPLIAKYWRRVFGAKVSTIKTAAMGASPMFNIDKVANGSSIAIYHGENDPRAPIQHSYNMLGKLKEHGIAGELVTFEGEGHRMKKEANSLYMHYRIEEFLCKKFGMDTFDAGDDVKKFEDNTGTVKWSAEYAKKKQDV